MSIALQVDENGISVKSYREVRTAIADRVRGIFGDSIDLSPSSPDGQLIDLFVYAYSDAAEAIQAAFANLDPSSAEGVFLDNLGNIMGEPRNGDDDATYRARLISSTTTGLATFDNMLSYLRANIAYGVNMVANDEPTTDSNGIPGHKIAVYLPQGFSHTDSQGHDDTDNFVAAHIWYCKPAGIGTYGSSTGVAHDKSGAAHDVNFSKVEASSPYYMRITITEYKEEDLPDDYAGEVVMAVVDWASREYTPGKDIIPKRVIQAIYTVPGIDDVVVEVSADGSTGWTSSRIPVDLSHYAYFPEENITVTKSE